MCAATARASAAAQEHQTDQRCFFTSYLLKSLAPDERDRVA